MRTSWRSWPNGRAQAHFKIIHDVFTAAGFAISAKKEQFGPGIQAIGFTLDLPREHLSYPDEKAKVLSALISAVLNSGSVARKPFENVVGVLTHLCVVIPDGKVLLEYKGMVRSRKLPERTDRSDRRDRFLLRAGGVTAWADCAPTSVLVTGCRHRHSPSRDECGPFSHSPSYRHSRTPPATHTQPSTPLTVTRARRAVQELGDAVAGDQRRVVERQEGGIGRVQVDVGQSVGEEVVRPSRARVRGARATRRCGSRSNVQNVGVARLALDQGFARAAPNFLSEISFSGAQISRKFQ